MMKEIDARGLACPEPVVLTKKALDRHQEITVIVSEKVSEENVRRFAESMGCRVSLVRRDADVYLTITRPAHSDTAAQPDRPDVSCRPAAEPAQGPAAAVIASDIMGSGSDELGAILMKSFIHTLIDIDPRPDILIFLNNGVKLAVSGSEVLDDLEDLSGKGVDILVCGTCLGFFDIKDKLAVGRVSNMYEIAETMLKARKVIRI